MPRPHYLRRSWFVYIVQAGEDGPVKIGKSQYPEWRIQGLQHACPYPLRLLRVFAPEEVTEGQLHRAFKADRLHGEWFKPDAVLDFLARLEA